MFVIGHVANALRSGAMDGLPAPAALAELLLPDAVACHDTGYAAALASTPAPAPAGRLPFLTAVHLLGDAYIHFGDEPEAQRRAGWAYRAMRPVVPRMGRFYERAGELGCLVEAPKDSVRGWAHSIAEYCVDHLQVTRDGFFTADELDDLDRSLSRLARSDGDHADTVEVLAGHGLVNEKPMPHQRLRYYAFVAALGVRRAHVGGLALKFGLCLSPTALALVEEELDWFVDTVGEDELRGVLRDLDGWVGEQATALAGAGAGTASGTASGRAIA